MSEEKQNKDIELEEINLDENIPTLNTFTDNKTGSLRESKFEFNDGSVVTINNQPFDEKTRKLKKLTVNDLSITNENFDLDDKQKQAMVDQINQAFKTFLETEAKKQGL